MIVTIALLALLSVLGACLLLVHQRTAESLGLLPVAIFVFIFLYVIQPLYLIQTERIHVFLTDQQIAKGMLLPALTLVFFLWGWSAAGQTSLSHAASKKSTLDGNPLRLWRFGLATAATGFFLFSIFIANSGGFEVAFSGAHGRAMAWQENTAYLYFSPWWVLSGMAMMIVAARHSAPSVSNWSVPFLFGGAMYAYSLLVSSRGTFFATTVVIVLSYYLGRRRPVPLSSVLVYLGIACLGVLMVLGYRSQLHLGENRPETPTLEEVLTAAMAVDDGHTRQRITGVEFVYHAAALDTVDVTRRYHMGIGWLYLYTLHLVPRVLWPEKPYGFDSNGITWDDIFAVTGLRVAGGAAPGMVADIYMHFGPLSPLFFFFCGLFAQRLYTKATRLESSLAVIAYVMLYALSLNAFAQGFGAILVPFPYAIAPALLFHWLRRERPSIWSPLTAGACQSEEEDGS